MNLSVEENDMCIVNFLKRSQRNSEFYQLVMKQIREFHKSLMNEKCKFRQTVAVRIHEFC